MPKFEVIRTSENTTEERYTVVAEDQETANRMSLGMEPHTIKETNRSQVYFEPYIESQESKRTFEAFNGDERAREETDLG